MTSKTLRRTTYINPKTGLGRDDATANQESRVDMEEYFQPLEQITGSGLHEWGVADGLSVIATLGSPNLKVTAGIALDGAGRHIALAVGGIAEIHPHPEQGVGVVTVSTPVKVAVDGAPLPAIGNSGEYYVTIQWRESFDEQKWSNSQQTIFEMIHTPWLRLVDVNNFNDVGNELILAKVTLDNAGNVLALNPALRRHVGVAVEVVHLQRTVNTPLRIERGPAAEIRARGDRGLEINTPFTDPNGNTSWQQRLSIDGNTGNVGIGTSTPAAALEVNQGSTNDLALRLTSAGAGWGSGLQVHNSGAGGKSYGLYTDAEGTLHIADVDTQQDRLLVDSTGRIGIGTAQPSAALHVNGTTWLQGDSTPLPASAGKGIGIGFTGETGYIFAYDYSTWQPKNLFINHVGGNVGIGTTDPQATLHVQGDLKVSGKVQGDLTVSGEVQGGGTRRGWVLGGPVGTWRPGENLVQRDNWLRLSTSPQFLPGGGHGPFIRLGSWSTEYHDLAVNSFWAAGAHRYDLAEVTPVRPQDALEQGDAVVIDCVTGLRVTRSTQAYDKAVYGIVSSYAQAALVIGSYGGPETVADRQDILPIALVGRVKAKVSDENGSIEIGDLLTTANTPGHLMKSTDPMRHSGAIAGKALEPFAAGHGTIFVLVTLQ